LGKTNYAELKSGSVEIDGRRVPASPLSSLAMARRVARRLRGWILDGGFQLSQAVEPLPREGTVRGLREQKPSGTGGAI
jgi:L-aspartate semialdehyde sulfurtransferase